MRAAVEVARCLVIHGGSLLAVPCVHLSVPQCCGASPNSKAEVFDCRKYGGAYVSEILGELFKSVLFIRNICVSFLGQVEMRG